MARVCQFTGRKTRFGHKLTRRGLAKAKGGVGIKTTGCTKRKFKANIQKVRAWIDGRTVRVKISTRALKKGLISKPPQHKKNKPAPAAI
jgi:large subunit ribosomal protein L28